MADVFTRRAYLTDLSDEQWAIVERELPPARGERGRSIFEKL